MQAPRRVRQPLNQPDFFDLPTLKYLEEFLFPTFPDKDVMKEVSAHNFRELISNAAVELIYKPERDWQIAR